MRACVVACGLMVALGCSNRTETKAEAKTTSVDLHVEGMAKRLGLF